MDYFPRRCFKSCVDRDRYQRMFAGRHPVKGTRSLNQCVRNSTGFLRSCFLRNIRKKPVFMNMNNFSKNYILKQLYLFDLYRDSIDND
jgi:hypothetical protein